MLALPSHEIRDTAWLAYAGFQSYATQRVLAKVKKVACALSGREDKRTPDRDPVSAKSLNQRPRGGSDYHVRLYVETFPVLAPLYLTVPSRTGRKLSPYLWSEIIARHETESLRALAKEYGVSHEAVRRALNYISG